MIDIGGNLERAQGQIALAAARSGRQVDEVTLMAVTKTVASASIQTAVDAGARVLGENRVQEAERKRPEVRGNVEWHLIGRLQSNKARRAALLFDAIHSVDRPRLVSRLATAAAERDHPLGVYVQVEFVRSGEPDTTIETGAQRACALVSEADSLRLVGLMTLPPFDPDPEGARPYFVRLRELRDRISHAEGVEIPGLSMGMSGDYEVAVEEGATIIRLGTTLFGQRT